VSRSGRDPAGSPARRSALAVHRTCSSQLG